MTAVWNRISKPMKDELAKQRSMREEKKASGKPFSLVMFLCRWTLRLFYTLCLFMFAYVLIIGGTVLIPTAMGYIVGSLGYSLSNNAEFLLALLSGLFFTGWTFFLSFKLMGLAWKKYLGGMKGTVPADVAKKMDDLQ